MAQMAFAVADSTGAWAYRYFSAHGCVSDDGDRRLVFVGGTLIGSYDVSDKATRNAILVKLSEDPKVHLGKLAEAFELGREQLRNLQHKYESGGLRQLMEIKHGGRERVVTPALRRKLHKLFESGASAQFAHQKINEKISLTMVARTRRAWRAEREAKANALASATDADTAIGKQLALMHTAAPGVSLETADVRAEQTLAQVAQELPSSNDMLAELIIGPSLHDSNEASSELIIDSRKQYVQHAGTFIVLALLQAFGLYRHTETLRENAVAAGDINRRYLGKTALRVALDAAVIALLIGQKCIEGVRRIATPSAKTLLRVLSAVPSESWVREVIGRFAHARGQALHLVTSFALIEQAERERDARAWFYIDGHMRPYTGRQVIRKGWRMQDKCVRPGSSDYWVHDQDGRPLLRISSPSHESMTDRLRPVARLLRDGLDQAGAERTKVALVFDRAGAFPSEMAALRDAGFEFVTYERGPYARLLSTQFDQQLTLAGEVIRYCEVHDKNLGRGRGRVRRINLLMQGGEQINIVGVSEAEPQQLIQAMLARWALQENQFKYGVERLGINQLDGRRTDPVPPDELIPNPARRRLINALGVARQLEGDALRHLAHLPEGDPKRVRWEQDLARSRRLQSDLHEQRPSLPKKIRLADSELAGKLVRHRDNYKLVVDTLRILIANIVAELAATLGPLLARPAEAKKTLDNLLAAPAVVYANRKLIVVELAPAGTRRELTAFRELLRLLNARKLTLPGDPTRRHLVLKCQTEGHDPQ
jgi:hypothetical protein